MFFRDDTFNILDLLCTLEFANSLISESLFRFLSVSLFIIEIIIC